ncbi:MAG TPA: HoxN/HupN/NixA family nickel/cobalt transporter [Acidimicrobiales bacterium]|nr:HoxN/HupN/NixA family nickel/cobalt transporter [Acidimicrobiales bacterium]
MTSTAPNAAPSSRLKSLRAGLSPGEMRRLGAMTALIAAFHAAGWGVFALVILPAHYRALGLGVAVTAYTLGMRHAFDADHIAAIDNTTRKFMSEGKRPLSVGFFFSLGHSTVVVGLGIGITIAARTVFHAVKNPTSVLEQGGGIFGTAVSGTFLYLIALLNVIVLVGVVKVFLAMRKGIYDDDELEAQLNSRGLMFRFFGRLMNSIHSPWQMYPLGILFGLGFDTATEIALLAATAGAATSHLPWYSILCLPILFTAGMTLLDTIDGSFMNFAYGWAFSRPVRKVYYNIVITGLSVLVAFFIGTVEILGLIATQTHLGGPFWAWAANFNINRAGFIIAAAFVFVWLAAVSVWKWGHVEDRWDRAAMRATAAREATAVAREAIAPAGEEDSAVALALEPEG